jgi:multidrug resistance efflux pump
MTQDIKNETSVKSSEPFAENGDGSETVEQPKTKKVDFTRKLTKIILIISALYFVWYIVSDRLTPMTDQARVRALITPLVPQVSGKISNIHVGGDKKVKQGDVLFEIDDRDYQFAVNQAEGNLELAGQNVGANTSAVVAAKANLVKAEADLVAKKANANRIIEVAAKGVVSQSEADRARGILASAEQNVVNAQANYEKAKSQLGKGGSENANIKNALSALANAQLDLSRTKIVAPTDGVISYAKVDVGYYAAVGSKIMTFISTEHVWIEASYRENNLGNIKKNDPVDIVLDSAPGQIFSGSIVSIGYGVSFDKSVQGELPTPQKPTGWMREAQRFTVIIKINEKVGINLLREGGQADVITYTGSNFIINGLGKVWVYLSSLLTYIY